MMSRNSHTASWYLNYVQDGMDQFLYMSPGASGIWMILSRTDSSSLDQR